MEMERLRGGIETIAAHMTETGYSDSYVRKVVGFAKRLIEEAPSLGGWDDAAVWAEGLRGEGASTSYAPQLAICRQFEEEAILPRTPEARRYERKRTRDALCPGFSEVIAAYEASPDAASKTEAKVRNEISCAASFMRRLEALGRTSPAEVTEDDVIEVLTDEDGMPAFSASYARRIRSVLGGATGVEGCGRLQSLVPVPRKWRKVRDSLREDEVAAICKALADDDNGVSLRDRAIVTLLIHTGMRACDVAALRLDAIDWRTAEISFTQLKTGTPVVIPLLPRVGNAIFDYLMHERGTSTDPHVFLSVRHPCARLKAGSIRNSVDAVLDAAGVRCEEGDTRGAHLFRRTLATEMLAAGSDRAVAASVLGHASPSTTDSYMVASVEGLRKHASLDVTVFPLGKGVTVR